MAIDFPNSPTTNQEFTSAGRTWVYDGAKWGAKTTQGNLVSDAAPSTAAQGQIWVNSNTARSYVYLDSTWVEMANTLTSSPLSRNIIINGNFDVWQRGTSFSSNGFTADRWWYLANDSITRQSFSSVPEVPNAQYYYRMVPLQAGAYHGLNQIIENGAVALSGKTVTLSFWARSNSNNAWTLGVLTALYGDSQQVWNYASLTTSWQKFTFTSNIPMTDGSSIHRYLRFTTPDSSINYGYDLAQVQMEVGSTATAFSLAGGTVQGELAACQRYYYRYTGGSFGAGVYYNSTTAYVHNPLPVTMRVTPSVSPSSGTALTVWSPSGGLNSSSLGPWSSGPGGVAMQIVTSTATTGHGCWVVVNGSGYVEYVAELP